MNWKKADKALDSAYNYATSTTESRALALTVFFAAEAIVEAIKEANK